MMDINFEDGTVNGKPMDQLKAHLDWMADIYAEFNPPTTIVFYEMKTHHRGRFVHSHKGKHRRQHALKTHYMANRVEFSGCYPTTGGDDFGNLAMEHRFQHNPPRPAFSEALTHEQ